MTLKIKSESFLSLNPYHVLFSWCYFYNSHSYWYDKIFHKYFMRFLSHFPGDYWYQPIFFHILVRHLTGDFLVTLPTFLIQIIFHLNCWSDKVQLLGKTCLKAFLLIVLIISAFQDNKFTSVLLLWKIAKKWFQNESDYNTLFIK